MYTSYWCREPMWGRCELGTSGTDVGPTWIRDVVLTSVPDVGPTWVRDVVLTSGTDVGPTWMKDVVLTSETDVGPTSEKQVSPMSSRWAARRRSDVGCWWVSRRVTDVGPTWVVIWESKMLIVDKMIHWQRNWESRTRKGFWYKKGSNNWFSLYLPC